MVQGFFLEWSYDLWDQHGTARAPKFISRTKGVLPGASLIH